jgi:hypothetical protein
MDYTLHDGVLRFQLDGEERELKATVQAALTIDKVCESLGNAAYRIQIMSASTIFEVILAGLHAPKLECDALKEQLFTLGFENLAKIASEFLILLQNGGKMPEPEEEEDAPAKGKP